MCPRPSARWRPAELLPHLSGERMVDVDVKGLSEGEGIGTGDHYQFCWFRLEWGLMEGDNYALLVQGAFSQIGSDISCLLLLF